VVGQDLFARYDQLDFGPSHGCQISLDRAPKRE